MPQSLSAVYVHLVFATRRRTPWLHQPHRDAVHARLASLVRGTSSECLRVGGTADHVHLVLRLGRTDTIAHLVERIKSVSTPWIADLDPGLSGFRWQKGYGCFSLGKERLAGVLRYVDNQEQHHAKASFEAEFMGFLARHDLDPGPHFSWD